ncbi:hypothetical protein Pint_20515 [Pistacia integerrima]|uniref:Uncharacterized protein n=1 Tax=Pistacia integerrima TaxID=434235 RepID=A0ACC0XGX9_9ROSI|nr:hypothetical protein Pint_20515 [Pistacia integerrima]
MVNFYRKLGIGIVTYSPLARGFFGGTTKIKNFDNNFGSLRVKLTKDDLEEISAVIPINEVAGSRFKDDNYLRVSWKFAITPTKEIPAAF